MQITSWLREGKKNEKVILRNPVISVIIFIISIAVLGYAYYLAITGVTSPIADKFMTAIGLGVVGTFMFFYSLSGFALKLVQASKKIYLKDLNMFVLRQTNWTIFRNNILNIKCSNIST